MAQGDSFQRRETMHKQKIEEFLRANAMASPEEKMPRRLVNIIKELVAWIEELEETQPKYKAGAT
jgi:hypothetical protein